ncbi:hypothetical protein [Nonomuraea sp. NPDC052265]|uniref:hypothetical protein n=1 Tax=Nonomuraea sp. NPDC052265 TaxID=3364374 RepID=UPI0037CC2060
MTFQQDLSELSLRMIAQYALGGGLADPARVVSAFETVLTIHLGRLYERDDDPARGERALAYLREVVDGVLARGGSELVTALAKADMSPARIRVTVLMIMLAAHHTAGVAVSWTLHLLARNPGPAAPLAGPARVQTRQVHPRGAGRPPPLRLHPLRPRAARLRGR